MACSQTTRTASTTLHSFQPVLPPSATTNNPHSQRPSTPLHSTQMRSAEWECGGHCLVHVRVGSGGWVGLGQYLMQEQGLGSRLPSLPAHEAEQSDCPVPRPDGLLTANRPHRSAREREAPSSFVYACVRGGLDHLRRVLLGHRGHAGCTCTYMGVAGQCGGGGGGVLACKGLLWLGAARWGGLRA